MNAVSVGIFAWTRLEPEEGRYDFEWLDQVIDRLWKGGIGVVLATPSGARPAWMVQKYPEVLRVDADLRRRHFGDRHNHCLTSPVYREKVAAIDTELAKRYGRHPAVKLWHLSNEYGGDCRCELCAEAFREWLKNRYGDLEGLNHAWWTGFWSQRYTEWRQVEPPAKLGEAGNPGMWLDWQRFTSDQCKSFLRNERDAVKAAAPDLPVTTNFMTDFWDYDYFSLAEELDVACWDSYPSWGEGDDLQTAAITAMNHDLIRSLKDQPFLLMESTPSQVNWKPVCKLKKPGCHLLASMQAVAHGSDSVMYFQWRKGRGGAEAFHGAVVSHDGRGDTRVFRDVEEVGETLRKLQPLVGTPVKAQACIIYDWQNRWAIDFAETGKRYQMDYQGTVRSFYRSLWEAGITVDFRDMRDCTELSGYKLVIAPMLFMQRNGFAEKLRSYVENGGTLLMSYFCGIVNQDDLTFLGDAPHGLTDVLGLRVEEWDALMDEERNEMRLTDGRRMPLKDLCDLTSDITAEVIGTYGKDFYAGRPCLTRNRFGKGTAWYLAARPEQEGVDAVVNMVREDLGLRQALTDPLPSGVIATLRGETVFLQNYSGQPQQVTLSEAWTDLLSNEQVTGTILLPVYGLRILKKA